MQQYACSSEAIACMCYFCHTLGNNPAAPPHRGENCRDPRNSHSKKAKPLHSSHCSVASSAAHRAPAALQSSASKPSLPPFSAAASSAAPPLFFIQTECGRYVDSSLPQGLVLSDHAAAAGRGQLFSMSHDGVITDVTTQLVLDCKEVKKGSSVVLTHPNGSSSQRWVMCPDGSIRLLDAAAALSLDVRRHIAALAPLIVWTPHGRANQRFRIVSAFWFHLEIICSAPVSHASHRLLPRRPVIPHRLPRHRLHPLLPRHHALVLVQAAGLQCTHRSSLRATPRTAACNANATAATASAASASPPRLPPRSCRL